MHLQPATVGFQDLLHAPSMNYMVLHGDVHVNVHIRAYIWFGAIPRFWVPNFPKAPCMYGIDLGFA